MKTIVYVRESDGKRYDTIEAAVRDYKCPCPCEDGLCKLHPMVTLHDGNSAHMCNLEYAKSHAEQICQALGLVPEVEERPNPERRFLALIDGHAVRDCQVCVDNVCDPINSDWYDYERPDIYVNVFQAPTEEDAMKAVVKFTRTHEANIKLIPVESL